MGGRGFLKSHLAQVKAAKEQEEQQAVQTPVPIVTNSPSACRGRRVINIIYYLKFKSYSYFIFCKLQTIFEIC